MPLLQNPALFGKNVVDLEPVSGYTGQEQLKRIREIMSGYGDGARAVVRVKWMSEDSGHVFIAEQVGDETWLVDTQCGSDPNSNAIQCDQYMNDAKPGYTRILRIDNAKLSYLIGKAVRNRRRH